MGGELETEVDASGLYSDEVSPVFYCGIYGIYQAYHNYHCISTTTPTSTSILSLPSTTM